MSFFFSHSIYDVLPIDLAIGARAFVVRIVTILHDIVRSSKFEIVDCHRIVADRYRTLSLEVFTRLHRQFLDTQPSLLLHCIHCLQCPRKPPALSPS